MTYRNEHSVVLKKSDYSINLLDKNSFNLPTQS